MFNRSLVPRIALSVLCSGLFAACDSPRARPTGLGQPLPSTSVAISSPANDALVPSDSVTVIEVEASGSLQAVELIVKRVAVPDTLMAERRTFPAPQQAIRLEFELQVPPLVTGVHLEIRALAEDIIGGRHPSEPVFVQVIECDVFPLACDGGV